MLFTCRTKSRKQICVRDIQKEAERYTRQRRKERAPPFLPPLLRKPAVVPRRQRPALLQNRLQIPGDGAVFQDEAGNTDAAVFPDISAGGAILPQGQIGL